VSASENPLVSLGGKLFRFSVVYSIIATLLSIALATAGLPVPDALVMVPFNVTAVGDALSKLSNQPLPLAIAGVALSAAYSMSNVFIGSFIAIPKLFESIVSAINPALIPIARFLGGVCAAAIILYLANMVLGR